MTLNQLRVYLYFKSFQKVSSSNQLKNQKSLGINSHEIGLKLVGFTEKCFTEQNLFATATFHVKASTLEMIHQTEAYLRLLNWD